MAMTLRDGLPLLTIDMDGVICSPIFGRNHGISRDFLDPDASPTQATVLPRWLSQLVDHARFGLRRPLPETQKALSKLRQLRTVVLLTGRRNSPEYWLRWHGFDSLLDGVFVNETTLPSAYFKLEMIAELGAIEHVDDDARTVQLLAQRSKVQPYVRDWPRNRGLRLEARVRRIADLAELVARLRSESADR